MKVRILVPMAGPDEVRNRGDILDLKAAEATRLLDAGFAELVRAPAAETAVAASQTETTSG